METKQLQTVHGTTLLSNIDSMVVYSSGLMDSLISSSSQTAFMAVVQSFVHTSLDLTIQIQDGSQTLKHLHGHMTQHSLLSQVT